MSNISEDKQKNLLDKSEDRVFYLLPQDEIHKDEINLWELFISILQYKNLIIIFGIIGIILGFLISIQFGKTTYKNSVVFQYDLDLLELEETAGVVNLNTEVSSEKPKTEAGDHFNEYIKSEYLPHKDFLNFQEIKLSSKIISRFWPINQNSSVYEIKKSIDESKKIVFEALGDEKISSGETNELAEFYTLSVETDNAEKTLKALNEIFNFFHVRNSEKVIHKNSGKIRSLQRQLNQSAIGFDSFTKSLDDIYIYRVGQLVKYYIQNTDKSYYIEQTGGIVRAINWASSNKNFDEAIGIREITGIQSINKSLINDYKVYLDTEKLYFTLSLELQKKLSTIQYYEEKLEAEIDSTTRKISQLEKEIFEITNEVKRVESKLSKVRNSILLNLQRVKKVAFYRIQIEEASLNKWINIEEMQDIPKKLIQREESNSDKENKQQNIESSFDDRLEMLNTIQKIRFANYLHEQRFVEPWKLIQAPSIHNTKVNYSISFDREGDADQIEELNSPEFLDIFYSKKIVLFTFILASFLGLITVFIRIFFISIKNSPNYYSRKNDFLNALKSLKI